MDQKVTVDTAVLDVQNDAFDTAYSYYIDTEKELKPLEKDVILEAAKEIHIVATVKIPSDLTGVFGKSDFNTADITDNTLAALDKMITVNAIQSNQ